MANRETFILNTQEMDTISYLPSPPLSDTTAYMNEDQDQENAFEKNTITTIPSSPPKETITELKPDPAATPSKKRGRPKTTNKVPSQKKPKPDTKEKKQKQQDNTTSKPKRGRQPGSTASETSFTQEQDAYIRELYTSPEKFSNKDIHAKFEEKFSTGKSSNVIRFRWYKLKEGAIVLSSQEEAALKKAIETIETNKAQAVLNEYGNSGDFTKLSQGFVIKKMKEWAAGGSTTTQAKEETGDGEDEEEK